MKPPLPKRGTAANPENRFERIHVVAEDDEGRRTPTELYRDASRTILSENDSPDIPFRFSLNPYRGCEHGCIYCYARPSHEYLGFSAGLDFERRILVKEDAPVLLRRTLLAPRWEPQVVALSGNTDCYQPIERQLGITRRCLEVFAEFRNPVAVITKGAGVARDADLLGVLAGFGAARVHVSVTSLDPEVARRMEPRASRPERRLEAIASLAAAGVPVSVMVAPVVPGLNDEEIPAILAAAKDAGAQSAGWILMRLPAPVDALFESWLGEQFPNRKERVLRRIRDCRGGKLSDTRFGRRMRGEGAYAGQIRSLYEMAARRTGLDRSLPPLRTDFFRRPPQPGDQLRLC
jgi:DNA repair photolyase